MPPPERIRQAARIARAVRGLPAARHAINAANPVAHANPTVYVALLRLLARGSRSVLDVGTGMMDSLALFPVRTRIGVDAHRPYLERRRPGMGVPLNLDAGRISEVFVAGAVDLVTLVDAIEHLPAQDAMGVLEQAERIAGRRVVVVTPRGWFPQDGFDAFGLGGEEWQRHRSTWDVDNLTGLGYRVVVLDGHHGPENQSFREAFPDGHERVDGLVAWKDTHG